MATFASISFYILFFLAGLCLAEVLSIQNAKHGIGNTITDLSTRVRRNSGYSFGIGAGEEQQTELLDIVLVASVDGRLHALNRTSGVPIWSMSSSLNGEVPATLGPLIRTQHPKIDPDLVDENSDDQEVYVIEPQSGEIYVMSKPDAPLQRLPFTMPQLVDMSPFSFSGEGDNRVFVGRKETALLLVELETGRVKATLDSECPWDPFEDLASENAQDEDLDLDELEGSKPPKYKPTEVFIGRTGKYRGNLVALSIYLFIPIQTTIFRFGPDPHPALQGRFPYRSYLSLCMAQTNKTAAFRLCTEEPRTINISNLCPMAKSSLSELTFNPKTILFPRMLVFFGLKHSHIPCK